jgi:hypothetical protein
VQAAVDFVLSLDLSSSSSSQWCLLFSPKDGLFFYNKGSRQIQTSRPAGYVFPITVFISCTLMFTNNAQDISITGAIVAMFRAKDREGTGLVSEDDFYATLEDDAPGKRTAAIDWLSYASPAGLQLTPDQSFSLLQLFDRAEEVGLWCLLPVYPISVAGWPRAVL